MTLKQYIGELVLESANQAKKIDFEDLVRKEKARTANCPECARMFIKQTSNENEVCFNCAGEDE